MLALVPLVLAWGATYEPTPTQLGYGLNRSAGDFFGASVAVSGTLLAIGAIGTSAGTVSMHAWNGTDWNQRGADIDGTAVDSAAGTSVALSENTVVIGAPSFNSGVGQVRVYAWNSTDWVQRGSTLVGGAGSFFGWSVAISGGSIAVGAVGVGTVQVYDYVDTDWQQRGLTLGAGDQFGRSVSFHGDVLAVGAIFSGVRSGHVQVFDWDGTAWTQRGGDIGGGDAYDLAGYSVALSGGNAVAVGAINVTGPAGPASGRVQVFEWNGTDWRQSGPDLDGATAEAQFGCSVAFTDGTLVVGAVIAEQVRVYDLVARDWHQRGPTLNGSTGDSFGFSVAATGGLIVIGAPAHDGGQVWVYSYAAVDHGDGGGLSPGEIAGIAIGAMVVAVAGVWLAVRLE
jgi:hypothetical protein